MSLSWQWFFMLLFHTLLGSESPDECHPESSDECRPDSVSMLQLHRRPYMAQMQQDSELTKDSDAPITAPSMTAASDFWPAKNGNVLRTGSSSALAPTTLLSSPPNFSFFETEGNRSVRAAPMIDGDKNIYVSTVPGRIYKLNPSGKVLWMHEEAEKELGEKEKNEAFKAGLTCVPAFMDGKLFSANQGGEVFALNMSDGAEVWRTRLTHGNSWDAWSMTAVDGIVISAASTLQPPFHHPNNMLFTLNATSGKVLWQFASDNNILIYNISVACANGSSVFIGNQTGKFYGIKDINGDGTMRQSSGEAAIGYDVHAAFQGSAGIAPGMAFATPCDGMHVWHKP